MSAPAIAPRMVTVAIALPAHVSDQDCADTLYRVLRAACEPRSDGTYPRDRRTIASLEVHCVTLSPEDDAAMREALGFASPERIIP